MAYNGKTNWQLNEIVKPEDMNRIEQGIIDANKSLLIHNASADAHKNRFDEFVKGVTGSNATLTITKGNGTTSAVTVNNVANATNATKATQDSTGQPINTTYIKGLSASNATLTYTKGNGTTGTVTVNNVANAGTANKLSSESGNNYLNINTTKDSWDVLGSNPGRWLKSIRTEHDAPPYSLGDFSAAIAFGGGDTKGIITHSYLHPIIKFAGGNGSTASWKFAIYGGHNNETYDLNNFPTKTGGGASGTWGINISGKANTAGTATNITQRKSASAVTHADYSNNQAYVPDMSFMAFWNGAYNSGGNSNLTYSANGTIIGSKNIGSQTVAKANKLTDYAIPSGIGISTSATVYIFLGTWSGTSDSQALVLDIYTGEGFNAHANQNDHINLFVKDSWQETNSATSAFGGVAHRYSPVGRNANNFAVALYATAANSVNVYLVVSPDIHSDGFYTVSMHGGTWTHKGTGSTSAPGGTKQECINYDIMLTQKDSSGNIIIS